MSIDYKPRSIQIDTVSGGQVTSAPGQADTAIAKPAESPGVASITNPDNPDIRPIQATENLEPLRRRIANPPRRNWLSRFIRWLKKIFLKRDPTPEELAELNEDTKYRMLANVLTTETRVGEKRLKEALTRIGICSITTKKDRRIIKQVQFIEALMEPNAIWYRVNMRKLPFGVSVVRLTDEETVTNLSMSVGHKVSCRWQETTGVWYAVERASGTMGIPNHVNLAELWEKIPASRDNLTIPIGISNNAKQVYESLDNMVHLLIAGTTGGGKSNFLNVVLCTLIRRNRPDQLEMLLVDLKGGLEFNYYDGIPHLRKIPAIAPTGIIYERDQVAPLLNWVIHEGERRMAVLLKAGAKNIGEYNAHRRGLARMAQMVFVIDEWADVKLGKGGKETEERLANAVQRMRAVGIHVILCTQVPQSQVLGTMIKANLPAKFAFSCADLQGSMAILNNGHALQLQPRGRCIYRFQDEATVQTPFIPKNLILETILGAKGGGIYGEVKKRHDVTPEEIREWSIRENNGWLTQSSIETRYKVRGISQDELRSWLKEWENQTFIIGSSVYRVEPGTNNRGRRLVVTQDQTQPDPQQETTK
jgi:hypothetical protein